MSFSSLRLSHSVQLLSEKERSLTALYANSSEKERLLHDSREKLRVAQKEADDLRCELRDMETALGSQEVEMNALSEQLTEVGASVCVCVCVCVCQFLHHLCIC